MVEKGSITASCGCKIENFDDGEDIRYGSEDCDPIDGFHRVVVYAFYCKPCAARARTWPEFIETEEQADAWLDGDENQKG